MKKITTYSIQHHQKVFNLSSDKDDFFFIELGKGDLFNPEPRRSEAYAISFLKKGEIISQAGLVTERIKAPAVIALAPSVVRTLQETKDQPYIDVIFFKSDYLLSHRSNVFYLMEFDFFENDDFHHIHLNDEQAKKIGQIFDMLKQTLKEKHYHEADMIRSYIFLLIHELNSFLKSNSTENQKFFEKTSPLLANFKRLLRTEYLSQHSVSFYADKLNVTPKHLSELLKKQTGKTAGEWIDQALLLEAKVMLQNKTLSISEISDYLHFSDQSVFGKFFKTHSLQTPLQYRKSAE